MTNEGRDIYVTLISRHRHRVREKIFFSLFYILQQQQQQDGKRKRQEYSFEGHMTKHYEQGAKAQMKRERNAKQNQKKDGASQLKAVSFKKQCS